MSVSDDGFLGSEKNRIPEASYGKCREDLCVTNPCSRPSRSLQSFLKYRQLARRGPRAVQPAARTRRSRRAPDQRRGNECRLTGGTPISGGELLYARLAVCGSHTFETQRAQRELRHDQVAQTSGPRRSDGARCLAAQPF